ncbi:MAG: biopolymer transporter ExbD [Verrucomicrobia bacterium]|nr:biopolymer transporter ExbD [Verrucomicrobiota bacterium]
MKHKRRKVKSSETPQLEMTPMIAGVFQLLIFFIVTLKQEDILSQLDVARPAPDPNTKVEEKPDLLEIMVYNQQKLGGEGYSTQGRQVTLASLDRQLSRLASFSTNISVIIKCTGDSSHSNLVKLLDLCAKAGLKNLSVFSM